MIKMNNINANPQNSKPKKIETKDNTSRGIYL